MAKESLSTVGFPTQSGARKGGWGPGLGEDPADQLGPGIAVQAGLLLRALVSSSSVMLWRMVAARKAIGKQPQVWVWSRSGALPRSLSF